MALSLEDRLELHELPGRYGDIIDGKQWDRLDEIFTEDAIFELRYMGGGMAADMEGTTWEGRKAIRDYMANGAHPAAHLMLNVYVDEIGPVVQVSCRGVFPLPVEEGVIGAPIVFGGYYDKVVKTDQGWRIKHRAFAQRPIEMKWD